MAQDSDQSAQTRPHRTERVLISMIAAIVLLSMAAFVARMVGQVSGVDDWTAGAWPVVSVLPLLGLPLAMLLVIGYIVASAVRRSRTTRGTSPHGDTAPGGTSR